MTAQEDAIERAARVLPDDDDKHLTGPDLRVTGETSGLRGVTRLVLSFEEIA